MKSLKEIEKREQEFRKDLEFYKEKQKNAKHPDDIRLLKDCITDATAKIRTLYWVLN